jgi:hypothetical protein
MAPRGVHAGLAQELRGQAVLVCLCYFGERLLEEDVESRLDRQAGSSSQIDRAAAESARDAPCVSDSDFAR